MNKSLVFGIIMLALVISACSTTEEIDEGTYLDGCVDAVYIYILDKERAEENEPDLLYSLDYCTKIKRERLRRDML